MDKRVVYVDFDGTMLQFCKALEEQMIKKHGIDIDIVNQPSYTWKELDKHIRGKLFNEIGNNVEMYKKLEFFEGAKDSLERLKRVANVRAYTGTAKKKEIYNIRRELILSLGLNEEPIVGMKPTKNKAFALIDDCMGVHRQWIADGSKAHLMLIDSEHNRRISEDEERRITRCRDFNDAVDRVIKLLEMERYNEG